MSKKFQCKIIPSSWLENNGRRLDCGPYVSGSIEAKELLKKHHTEKLSYLTTGHNGGIFNGPRFARVYVQDPEYGTPFLGSTDILQSDLSNLNLLSNKQVLANPALLIDEEWTLITCSGTVGRMAYARSDMKGMAGSQHFMRVVPDKEKVKSGYLYAYLSSRFGVPIVASGTYGAIIQHIEPHHIADLPVPRLASIENETHELVQRSADGRARANSLIKESIAEICHKLKLGSLSRDVDGPSPTIQTSSRLIHRMDSFYYSNINVEACESFDKAGIEYGSACLGDVADVWIPNIFKRVYVEDPKFGCPYFTGKEIYEISPSSELYLKKEVAEKYRLFLSRGMILIQDSGQISGILGRPVQVGKHLEGSACTNNMVRVHAEVDFDNGYIFALLSSQQGIKLLKREASGSSIPHLDERRIKSLSIPWPVQKIRESIGQKILQALSLRDTAIDDENKARALVERAIEQGGR